MVKQHRNILNWQSALGTLAISLGIFSIAQSSARAIPTNSHSFKLAQVGVRGRINGPTPLNLRPRTHIPQPTVNDRYGSYYRHPEYRDRHYDRYGYGHDHYHTHRRRNRHKRGPVIIINPANYSEYSNHNGYIRVIRK